MAAGALDSTEFAPVDLFGKLSPWTTQTFTLNAPRTLAGSVTVGRYIYLVGGDNGMGPVNTAERALILSPRAYNAKARLAIACPITSHVKGYPFEVALPPDGTIAGVVLADHVKNVDWRARRIVFEGKAPVETLTDVRERLRVLLGL